MKKSFALCFFTEGEGRLHETLGRVDHVRADLLREATHTQRVLGLPTNDRIDSRFVFLTLVSKVSFLSLGFGHDISVFWKATDRARVGLSYESSSSSALVSSTLKIQRGFLGLHALRTLGQGAAPLPEYLVPQAARPVDEAREVLRARQTAAQRNDRQRRRQHSRASPRNERRNRCRLVLLDPQCADDVRREHRQHREQNLAYLCLLRLYQKA